MQNQTPSRMQRQQSDQKNQKSKHTKMIALIIVLLVILFGALYIGHQVHELGDAQRRTNTILDKPIKNTVVKVVEPKLPEEIRPQVVQIIQKEPLYRLQQAADNPATFQAIANNIRFLKITLPQLNNTGLVSKIRLYDLTSIMPS